MATISIAPAGAPRGFGIVSGNVYLPRVGAGTADLVIATQTALARKVELTLGSVVLSCTVIRAVVEQGLLHARIVTGANGLRLPVKSKHYTGPLLNLVLKDVLADVGESLSPTSDAAVMGIQLEHWTTIAMTASQAVRCLVETAADDIAWRHQPDGKVWVGRETWPVSAVKDYSDVQGASPQADVWELSLLQPEVRPGTTLGGRRIDAVEYRIVAGGALGTTVWIAS